MDKILLANVQQPTVHQQDETTGLTLCGLTRQALGTYVVLLKEDEISPLNICNTCLPGVLGTGRAPNSALRGSTPRPGAT